MAVAVPYMIYAAMAASVAATAIQFQDSKNAADAQADAQEIHNREQAKAIDQSYGEMSAIEQQALLEEQDSNMNLQKQYMEARGRVNTMAAATGTGGASVDAQMLGLDRDRLHNMDSIQATRQSKLDNVTNQARQIKSQGTAGMDYSPISRPSWAAGALKIGSSAMSAYTSGQGALKANEMAKPVNGPTAGG